MRGLVIAFWLLATPVWAGDVAAGQPTDLSVTVYRAPWRHGGSIRLEQLGGFALVREARTVRLPAGESRLRFEGVEDGVIAASAIVTGLPRGVIEKNRDAAVLSPEALIHAARGAAVTLRRTDEKTGKVTEVAATIRSANAEGVVLETPQGAEAYQCSGLPEAMTFSRTPTGLSATPTLSVLTRSDRAITTTVTLSYLTTDFDWAANYVARLAPDGQSLNMEAWITLANNNSVGLPSARVQIVAGKLNWSGGDRSLADGAPRVIAKCWPRGSTSDVPRHPDIVGGFRSGIAELTVTGERRYAVAPPMAMAPMPPPPPPPPPEDLGDLKLYRLQFATTVAARQSKQVLMLDKTGVPFTRVETLDLPAVGDMDWRPAATLLRTKNDAAHHLGLALPAGAVAVFDQADGEALLAGQGNLADTAEGQDVELKLGAANDVQVRQTALDKTALPPEITPLTPELEAILPRADDLVEVEIANARSAPAAFELRLWTRAGRHVASPNQPMDMKDGRPIFRLTIPANGSVEIRYAVVD